MANFFGSYLLNRTIVCMTLCAFALAAIQPSPVYSFPFKSNIINFAIRMEKLIKKMNRYKDKINEDGLIGVLSDIKQEVEDYTEKEINIEKELKGIEKKVNELGGEFKKGNSSLFMKKLKKKRKGINTRLYSWLTA